jgi:hypothetical protein
MKLFLALAQLLDIVVSVILHTVGLWMLCQHAWTQAAFVFGMVSLWQIGCHGIKIFPQKADKESKNEK